MDGNVIRPKSASKPYYIVGPVYELVIHIDGLVFTAERHQDGRLKNCRINDRTVTPQEYVDVRDGA